MIRKVLSFGIINALSQGVYRASILLVYMLSTNNDLELFALNSTIIMLLTVFQSLGTAGLTLAANTFIPKYQKQQAAYSKVIINISLLTATVAAVISYATIDFIIPTILPDSIEYARSFKYLSIIIFLLCLSGVYRGFFFAKERYYSLAITSLFSALSIIISFFIFDFGLLNSYLISVLVEFFLLQIILSSFISLRETYQQITNKTQYKEVISFIVPASISGLMLTPVNIVILYILGLFNSPGLVSTFNYGMQIRNVIIFLPSVLGSVFLKFLSDNGEYSDKIKQMVVINVVISSLVSLLVIIGKLFNFEYLNIISLSDIIILSIGCLLFSLNSVIGNKIVSSLETHMGLLFNTIWAAVFIITTYLSYLYNVPSPFLGLLIAYVVLTIVQTKYIWRKI